MAVLEDPNIANQVARVEDTDALRVATVPRGPGYSLSATSGVIAAALAANSIVFGMRLDPGAPFSAFINRLVLQWTTIVAFTAPVTPGRRLTITRGSGAALSGGTLVVPFNKNSNEAVSEVANATGGDARIATTAALTATGITVEDRDFRTIGLAHMGAAGAMYERGFEQDSPNMAPFVLTPGQLLLIRTPQAMDAGGTWQLSVNVDWVEAPLLTA
jgi:hypothetical protein